jgi:phosphopantothenoylcysteine decarboxylase/phosphopantothenate--cysteine ligase
MNGRELLVGCSGGVAAYKTAALVSQLVQSGAGVSVVMTAAARQFIGPATFAALTGRPVIENTFDEQHFPLGAHIQLAEQAQLFCVAPATANVLAKAAAGIADDLLSTLLLSFRGPILLAPAMNSDMWEKPAVQRNVVQLRADVVHFVDPEEGWLSCRRRGVGRMADPQKIVQAIEALLQKPKVV